MHRRADPLARPELLSKSARNLIVSSILVETLEQLKMAYPQPAEDNFSIPVT